MSECWDEGGLRAYADRELPPEDLTRIAAHLGACAECHGRYNEIAARAVRVDSLMSALDVPAPSARPLPRRWVMPAVAGAVALAAAVALAFALIPRRAPHPQPVAAPHAPRVEHTIQAASPVPESAPESKPAAPVRAKTIQRARTQRVDYYLALDDQPIDTGVVVRVALEGAGQADVIFDADGRARAIRPVK
jgi:anti-sigma factor RsiW